MVIYSVNTLFTWDVFWQNRPYGVQGPWAASEGAIELLLSKLKNFSARIGIFIL